MFVVSILCSYIAKTRTTRTSLIYLYTIIIHFKIRNPLIPNSHSRSKQKKTKKNKTIQYNEATNQKLNCKKKNYQSIQLSFTLLVSIMTVLLLIKSSSSCSYSSSSSSSFSIINNRLLVELLQKNVKKKKHCYNMYQVFLLRHYYYSSTMSLSSLVPKHYTYTNQQQQQQQQHFQQLQQKETYCCILFNKSKITINNINNRNINQAYYYQQQRIFSTTNNSNSNTTGSNSNRRRRRTRNNNTINIVKRNENSEGYEVADVWVPKMYRTSLMDSNTSTDNNNNNDTTKKATTTTTTTTKNNKLLYYFDDKYEYFQNQIRRETYLSYEKQRDQNRQQQQLQQQVQQVQEGKINTTSTGTGTGTTSSTTNFRNDTRSTSTTTRNNSGIDINTINTIQQTIDIQTNSICQDYIIVLSSVSSYCSIISNRINKHNNNYKNNNNNNNNNNTSINLSTTGSTDTHIVTSTTDTNTNTNTNTGNTNNNNNNNFYIQQLKDIIINDKIKITSTTGSDGSIITNTNTNTSTSTNISTGFTTTTANDTTTSTNNATTTTINNNKFHEMMKILLQKSSNNNISNDTNHTLFFDSIDNTDNNLLSTDIIKTIEETSNNVLHSYQQQIDQLNTAIPSSSTTTKKSMRKTPIIPATCTEPTISFFLQPYNLLSTITFVIKDTIVIHNHVIDSIYTLFTNCNKLHTFFISTCNELDVEVQKLLINNNNNNNKRTNNNNNNNDTTTTTTTTTTTNTNTDNTWNNTDTITIQQIQCTQQMLVNNSLQLLSSMEHLYNTLLYIHAYRRLIIDSCDNNCTEKQNQLTTIINKIKEENRIEQIRQQIQQQALQNTQEKQQQAQEQLNTSSNTNNISIITTATIPSPDTSTSTSTATGGMVRTIANQVSNWAASILPSFVTITRTTGSTIHQYDENESSNSKVASSSLLPQQQQNNTGNTTGTTTTTETNSNINAEPTLEMLCQQRWKDLSGCKKVLQRTRGEIIRKHTPDKALHPIMNSLAKTAIFINATSDNYTNRNSNNDSNKNPSSMNVSFLFEKLASVQQNYDIAVNNNNNNNNEQEQQPIAFDDSSNDKHNNRNNKLFKNDIAHVAVQRMKTLFMKSLHGLKIDNSFTKDRQPLFFDSYNEYIWVCDIQSLFTIMKTSAQIGATDSVKENQELYDVVLQLSKQYEITLKEMESNSTSTPLSRKRQELTINDQRTQQDTINFVEYNGSKTIRSLLFPFLLQNYVQAVRYEISESDYVTSNTKLNNIFNNLVFQLLKDLESTDDQHDKTNMKRKIDLCAIVLEAVLAIAHKSTSSFLLQQNDISPTTAPTPAPADQQKNNLKEIQLLRKINIFLNNKIFHAKLNVSSDNNQEGWMKSVDAVWFAESFSRCMMPNKKFEKGRIEHNKYCKYATDGNFHLLDLMSHDVRIANYVAQLHSLRSLRTTRQQQLSSISTNDNSSNETGGKGKKRHYHNIEFAMYALNDIIRSNKNNSIHCEIPTLDRNDNQGLQISSLGTDTCNLALHSILSRYKDIPATINEMTYDADDLDPRNFALDDVLFVVQRLVPYMIQSQLMVRKAQQEFKQREQKITKGTNTDHDNESVITNPIPATGSTTIISYWPNQRTFDLAFDILDHASPYIIELGFDNSCSSDDKNETGIVSIAQLADEVVSMMETTYHLDLYQYNNNQQGQSGSGATSNHSYSHNSITNDDNSSVNEVDIITRLRVLNYSLTAVQMKQKSMTMDNDITENKSSLVSSTTTIINYYVDCCQRAKRVLDRLHVQSNPLNINDKIVQLLRRQQQTALKKKQSLAGSHNENFPNSGGADFNSSDSNVIDNNDNNECNYSVTSDNDISWNIDDLKMYNIQQRPNNKKIFFTIIHICEIAVMNIKDLTKDHTSTQQDKNVDDAIETIVSIAFQVYQQMYTIVPEIDEWNIDMINDKIFHCVELLPSNSSLRDEITNFLLKDTRKKRYASY